MAENKIFKLIILSLFFVVFTIQIGFLFLIILSGSQNEDAFNAAEGRFEEAYKRQDTTAMEAAVREEKEILRRNR